MTTGQVPGSFHSNGFVTAWQPLNQAGVHNPWRVTSYLIDMAETDKTEFTTLLKTDFE